MSLEFDIYFVTSCLFRSGVIIFGSDQEVGELMKSVRRQNATSMFSWIGSDGWGGRKLAYSGKEAEVGQNNIVFIASGTHHNDNIILIQRFYYSNNIFSLMFAGCYLLELFVLLEAHIH